MKSKNLKIKQTLIFLSGLLCVLLMSAGNIKADFESDYQQFLQIYDEYRQSHSQYLTSRSQYLQYQTLNAQTEALNSTKKFLLARNVVLISYIDLLKQRNSDATYADLLQNEQNFIQSHQDRINAVGSLDDAVVVSVEVEQRHLPLQLLAKKITGTIILTKVESLKTQFDTLAQDANRLLGELRNQGYDVTTQERWLLDAKNKAILASEKIALTRTMINNLQAADVASLNSNYNKVQFTVFEANQYVHEALVYLTELSESIKYGKY